MQPQGGASPAGGDHVAMLLVTWQSCMASESGSQSPAQLFRPQATGSLAGPGTGHWPGPLAGQGTSVFNLGSASQSPSPGPGLASCGLTRMNKLIFLHEQSFKIIL